MKAAICPICQGRGKVRKGFYDYSYVAQEPLYLEGEETEVCQSCNGKGWVEVQEEPANTGPYILPNPIYRYYYPNPVCCPGYNAIWRWSTT